MKSLGRNLPGRGGHTLVELVVATVASAALLAGLGSVMLIARQIAYTPSAAARRIDAADVINQLANELRFATLVLEHSPRVVEFLVDDRNGDGAAEKFRYEWSGVGGDPLFKSRNGSSPVAVIDSVSEFAVALVVKPQTTDFNTTTDSAETVLLSSGSPQASTGRSITAVNYSAQQIDPALFTSPIPPEAVNFNCTKVDFYGSRGGGGSDALVVQIRTGGDPNRSPTSEVQGQASIAQTELSSNADWNTVVFASPIRGLMLHRTYNLAWTGSGSAPATRLIFNDGVPSGVHESDDGGGSWQFMTARQVFYRLYGTYTLPGPTYTVTRNYVTGAKLALQSGEWSHARIDSGVSLSNTPELLSAHWRADFDTDPTTTNANGDGVADWAVSGGGSFDPATLIDGVWSASGALRTQPANDFLTTTTVEVRCRNTSIGGNGAVVQINADWQGGLHEPILVYVQRQADGSQSLTLFGKTSDVATTKLFVRPRLSGGFVRYRLTILPQSNVVNLQINDEDQGTFTYPTYAPSSTERYLTLFADTSVAEFDFIDLRVAAD